MVDTHAELLPTMRSFLRSAIVLLISISGFRLQAADPVLLLQSKDMTIRRKTVDEIQTLDDARIPGACLPLLADEGKSIRRQAARAIGSRYDQIPQEKLPAFLTALERCAREGPKDNTFVAQRAIGLLTRNFSYPAFSVSPDGRWVLFEQRRLPVIADIKLTHRQMLKPISPDKDMTHDQSIVKGGQIVELDGQTRLLKLMATNDGLENLLAPRWHPKGDAIALAPDFQWKFYHPIIIWRAKDGQVTTWGVDAFKGLYGKRFPHWATTTDFVEWRGRKAIIHIYDCDQDPASKPYDPKGVEVSVDIDTWKIALEKS